MSDRGCPFCDYQGPSRVLARYSNPLSLPYGGDVLIFEPINPVVSGHVLAVPAYHVDSAAESPRVTAETMAAALLWAAGSRDDYGNGIHAPLADFNLITSVGKAATQTVRHLHVHVVPRREGDSLSLPWDARYNPHYSRPTEGSRDE